MLSMAVNRGEMSILAFPLFSCGGISSGFSKIKIFRNIYSVDLPLMMLFLTALLIHRCISIGRSLLEIYHFLLNNKNHEAHGIS
ncbi:hypothetical protein SAMN02745220_04238 [Desulfopila aestuarii DSM 18488]|uniref:Uncharacterized protein n=1 Tax=Desulfopila aestuarii DSM 18488 TaxID=1121416 RepID=A0A1M7YGQ6_9BACT|nr:hypothetical protein SAMN02745220_04238 [Desulfopila aestuarii DSM 18488]